MEVRKIYPPVSPILEVELDEKIINYLWKIIDIAKTNNLDFKSSLVGNISSSLLLDDKDSFFYKRSILFLSKY